MTIPFISQEYRQRALLGVFGVLLLAGLAFAWVAFLQPGISLVQTQPQPPPPKVRELNLEVFSNPAFLELGQRQRVILAPETVGKTNPFLPPIE